MLGQVKDFSPGGAFICCQMQSEPGRALKMTIRVSPLSPPLEAKGKVTRSNIYCVDDETMCHGMSVRFTRISDDDRRFISSLISGYLNSESKEKTFPEGRFL
ncbi:MAG: PilZ domain-containing protein [Deltaproteobacteria bacterium]|nr:MAG: PilZ domain-containing protein [Deltaproteobacteria bacterium]